MRVQLMAGLTLLATACATPWALESAREDLSNAGEFTSAKVGYSGERSEYADALKLLARRRSSEDYFLQLTELSTGAPALYGLCGLHLLDSIHFRTAAVRVSASAEPVPTMQGCIVNSFSPADIVSGAWNGGSFTDFCDDLVQ